MKPTTEWPALLTVTEAADCLGLPPKDAYLMFSRKDFPQLIAGKRRGRVVAKRELIKFLEGESA